MKAARARPPPTLALIALASCFAAVLVLVGPGAPAAPDGDGARAQGDRYASPRQITREAGPQAARPIDRASFWRSLVASAAAPESDGSATPAGDASAPFRPRIDAQTLAALRSEPGAAEPEPPARVLARRWEDEREDASWTELTSQRVSSALKDLAIQGELLGSSCRTTVCKLDLRFQSLEEAGRFQQEASDGSPLGVELEAHEGAELTAHVYLERAGEARGER